MTRVVISSKPTVINAPTKPGRAALGRLVMTARLVDKKWSRKNLRDQLAQNVLIVHPETGVPSPYLVGSDTTIKSLEQGEPVRDPFLIDALAALKFIPHPAHRDRYWTANELRLVSYGLLDPQTGESTPRDDSFALDSDFGLSTDICVSA